MQREEREVPLSSVLWEEVASKGKVCGVGEERIMHAQWQGKGW